MILHLAKRRFPPHQGVRAVSAKMAICTANTLMLMHVLKCYLRAWHEEQIGSGLSNLSSSVEDRTE